MRKLCAWGGVGLVVLLVACASSETDVGEPPPSEPASSPTLPAPEGSGTKPDAGPPQGNLDCPAKCVASDSCHTSACDKTKGICVEKEKPDGHGCENGACNAGKCEPVPTCWGQYPQQFLHCDGASAWYRDLTTTLYPKSEGVKDYSCAKGEVGTDIALEFDPPAGTNVTVKLYVKGADADLDLIVLEDVCLGAATCAGAGVTAGTGTESVSFVSSGKKYYVVIDGKVTTPTSFHVEVACTP